MWLLLSALLISGCVGKPHAMEPGLDEKIGQMLMVGFRGMTVSESHFIAEDIRQRRLAATLADLGIGLNMAPVVDLCSNPDNPVIAKYERCFSADPNQVSAQAAAYIDAHHQLGVLTTLKHFPGHGSSRSDSHQGFTDITTTWSETELIPYRCLIAGGRVDAIMTAHVFNARLDDCYPATLSKNVITGLLRGELGFDGVVISDDMQMGAIVDHFGFETAIVRLWRRGWICWCSVTTWTTMKKLSRVPLP